MNGLWDFLSTKARWIPLVTFNVVFGVAFVFFIVLGVGSPALYAFFVVFFVFINFYCLHFVTVHTAHDRTKRKRREDYDFYFDPLNIHFTAASRIKKVLYSFLIPTILGLLPIIGKFLTEPADELTDGAFTVFAFQFTILVLVILITSEFSLILSVQYDNKFFMWDNIVISLFLDVATLIWIVILHFSFVYFPISEGVIDRCDQPLGDASLQGICGFLSDYFPVAFKYSDSSLIFPLLTLILAIAAAFVSVYVIVLAHKYEEDLQNIQKYCLENNLPYSEVERNWLQLTDGRETDRYT